MVSSGTYFLFFSPFIVAAAISLFIIFPVCRAFHSGLIAVRDPAIRVTPQNSWDLMDQILWRRLRWWIVGWSLGLVLYSGIFFLLSLADLMHPPLTPLLDGLSLPVAIIGLGSLLVASCIIWAPRRSSFAHLFLTTWLTGSLAYLVSIVSAALLMALFLEAGLKQFVIVEVRTWRYDPGVMYGAIVFVVFWSTLINVPIAVLLWRSARKKREKWFRFEK